MMKSKSYYSKRHPCVVCGKPTQLPHFCPKCIRKYNQSTLEAVKEQESKPRPKRQRKGENVKVYKGYKLIRRYDPREARWLIVGADGWTVARANRIKDAIALIDKLKEV